MSFTPAAGAATETGVMAHHVPTGDLAGSQRTAPSDDPSLPGDHEPEPADAGSARPAGMGMFAGVLFLLVFAGVLFLALIWAVQALG
jgi:hypothetical protein